MGIGWRGGEGRGGGEEEKRGGGGLVEFGAGVRGGRVTGKREK